MTPTVDISIDTLVLRGVSSERRFELAESLSDMLTSLAEAWLTGGGTVPEREESYRRLPPIRIAEPTAHSLGEAVARSTFQFLIGDGHDL